MLCSGNAMGHFNNPRTVRVIDDADNVRDGGNPVCVGMMKIIISVDDADRISDVRFQALGYDTEIATSSMVTEMAKGLSLEELRRSARSRWPTSQVGCRRRRRTADLRPERCRRRGEECRSELWPTRRRR